MVGSEEGRAAVGKNRMNEMERHGRRKKSRLQVNLEITILLPLSAGCRALCLQWEAEGNAYVCAVFSIFMYKNVSNWHKGIQRNGMEGCRSGENGNAMRVKEEPW